MLYLPVKFHQYGICKTDLRGADRANVPTSEPKMMCPHNPGIG